MKTVTLNLVPLFLFGLAFSLIGLIVSIKETDRKPASRLTKIQLVTCLEQNAYRAVSVNTRVNPNDNRETFIKDSNECFDGYKGN
jgi:hypothetical protein